MLIETLVLGLYDNNCYVVRKGGESTDCVIIDTALDPDGVIDHLKSNNLNPVAVLLTHGHADHIAAIPDLKKHYPSMKVVIDKADAPMLLCPIKNLSMIGSLNIKTEPADVELDAQDKVEFAGITFDIIHTPGHTPGGICFYNAENKVLFAGDTIFAGSVGRTDFPGYDQQKAFEQLITNIKTKLATLPPETKIYSGHGPQTTVRNELKHNPFLQ